MPSVDALSTTITSYRGSVTSASSESAWRVRSHRLKVTMTTLTSGSATSGNRITFGAAATADTPRGWDGRAGAPETPGDARAPPAPSRARPPAPSVRRRAAAGGSSSAELTGSGAGTRPGPGARGRRSASSVNAASRVVTASFDVGWLACREQRLDARMQIAVEDRNRIGRTATGTRSSIAATGAPSAAAR